MKTEIRSKDKVESVVVGKEEYPVFVTEDGTEFRDESRALEYEAKLKAAKEYKERFLSIKSVDLGDGYTLYLLDTKEKIDCFLETKMVVRDSTCHYLAADKSNPFVKFSSLTEPLSYYNPTDLWVYNRVDCDDYPDQEYLTDARLYEIPTLIKVLDLIKEANIDLSTWRKK